MQKSGAALSQPVYAEILRQIMSRELMPGDRVPEKKIADAFGISRSPVRDALRRLEGDGLVEIFPNRFAQVAQIQPEALREMGLLRASLDAVAVKLALLFGCRADFLALKKIAQDCGAASRKGDFPLRAQVDSDFHLALMKIGRNPMLLHFQQELNTRVQYAILHYPNEIKYTAAPLEDHVAIAEALLRGDEAAAVQISVDHVVRFYDLLEYYPESFVDYLKK